MTSDQPSQKREVVSELFKQLVLWCIWFTTYDFVGMFDVQPGEIGAGKQAKEQLDLISSQT